MRDPKAVYRGIRDDMDNGRVEIIEGETVVENLRKRTDLVNHSPTGFEWSYAGSGPAQLALALIADATGDDERALRVYQDFKFEVVASLRRMGWTMTAADVVAVVNRIDRGTD